METTHHESDEAVPARAAPAVAVPDHLAAGQRRQGAAAEPDRSRGLGRLGRRDRPLASRAPGPRRRPPPARGRRDPARSPGRRPLPRRRRPARRPRRGDPAAGRGGGRADRRGDRRPARDRPAHPRPLARALDSHRGRRPGRPRLPRPGRRALVAPRPDDRDGPRRHPLPLQPAPRGRQRGQGLAIGRPGRRDEPAPGVVRADHRGSRAVLSARRLHPRPLPARPGHAARVARHGPGAPHAGDLAGPGGRHRGLRRPRARAGRAAPRGDHRRLGRRHRRGLLARSTSRSCPGRRSPGSSARGPRSTGDTSTTGTSRPWPVGGSGSIRNSPRSPGGSASGSPSTGRSTRAGSRSPSTPSGSGRRPTAPRWSRSPGRRSPPTARSRGRSSPGGWRSR